MISTPDRAKLFFYLTIQPCRLQLTIIYTKKKESKLIEVNQQINFQLDN